MSRKDVFRKEMSNSGQNKPSSYLGLGLLKPDEIQRMKIASIDETKIGRENKIYSRNNFKMALYKLLLTRMLKRDGVPYESYLNCEIDYDKYEKEIDLLIKRNSIDVSEDFVFKEDFITELHLDRILNTLIVPVPMDIVRILNIRTELGYLNQDDEAKRLKIACIKETIEEDGETLTMHYSEDNFKMALYKILLPRLLTRDAISYEDFLKKENICYKEYKDSKAEKRLYNKYKREVISIIDAHNMDINGEFVMAGEYCMTETSIDTVLASLIVPVLSTRNRQIERGYI